MGTGQPDSEELIVKAQYFFPIDPTEDNLRKIQNRLTQIMMEEGFYTDDTPLPYMTIDRTMEFIRVPPASKNSKLENIKEFLGFDENKEPRERLTNTDEFLDGLGRLVDDYPFKIAFRFKTFQGEETEGYDIFVESTPVLLQKYRQLNPHSDYSYNIDNVVDQNKRELKRILGRLELEPTHGPYTEAESLDTRLSEDTVNQLNEHQYGRTAVQYVNEGDQCLQQNLLHAALSCYIQSIEWSILHYKITEEDTDLIESQQKGETGYLQFIHLVQKIQGDGSISQKTSSKLENINNAERRWMAHHKSGKLERQDVENVRSTLFRLTDELL